MFPIKNNVSISLVPTQINHIDVKIMFVLNLKINVRRITKYVYPVNLLALISHVLLNIEIVNLRMDVLYLNHLNVLIMNVQLHLIMDLEKMDVNQLLNALIILLIYALMENVLEIKECVMCKHLVLPINLSDAQISLVLKIKENALSWNNVL